MVAMPTICMFRGIKVYINWREHQPPHFHAEYGGQEVIVSIHDIEVLEGDFPNKQLKMLLGWAALHQEELIENWNLAEQQQELFAIEPLK
jgi:DNA polymerase/3'-5' exonuclease PolX